MSEERNIDAFSILILVLSVIAIVMEIIGPFAGFYLGGSEYRWSCLDCEYSTSLDYTLQIIIIILFVIQIIIALNELLPNKFIPMDVTKFGVYIAILTWVFALIGLASFGITYAFYEWWPDLGFYGIVVGGILNTILFFLQQRNK
jgi:uncharacterized Tic20 family protein